MEQTNFFDNLDTPTDFFEAINSYAEEVFHGNREKGFWDNCFIPSLTDGEEIEFFPGIRPFSEHIAWMTSELGEAFSAWQKDLTDKNLPQYKGKDVELADVVILILDYCGAHNIPLGTIIKDKIEFNKSRAKRHGKKN